MKLHYEFNTDLQRDEYIFEHNGKYSATYVNPEYPYSKPALLVHWINSCFKAVEDEQETSPQ